MSYELKKVKIAASDPPVPSKCLPTSSKPVLTTKIPDIFEAKLLILLEQEKNSRYSEDLSANQKVILEIVQLCVESKNWRKLGECAQILSKKSFAKKESITKMVQECMSYLVHISEKDSKIILINDLRDLSNGKTYLEIERARLTKALADIKEEEGFVKEASDILAELKIESIGTMTSVERIELFLHQMRLFVATGQVDLAQVLSKKVPTKFLDEQGNELLKLAYYKLKVKLERETSYQNTSRYYSKLSEISILSREEKKLMIANALIFSILAPHDNEKSTLMGELLKNPIVQKHNNLKSMLEYFLRQELIEMTEFCDMHSESLKDLTILKDSTSYGNKVRQDLRKRYIEHNLLLISKYYSRITIKRLGELLHLKEDVVEQFICDMVSSGSFEVKIDRFLGICEFNKKKKCSGLLCHWIEELNDVMFKINKVGHEVNKELCSQDFVI
ncbi:PSMD12.2 family protein [Megaselia abdita]